MIFTLRETTQEIVEIWTQAISKTVINTCSVAGQKLLQKTIEELDL